MGGLQPSGGWRAASLPGWQVPGPGWAIDRGPTMPSSSVLTTTVPPRPRRRSYEVRHGIDFTPQDSPQLARLRHEDILPQIGKPTDKQTDVRTRRQSDDPIRRLKDTGTERQTEPQTNKQTDLEIQRDVGAMTQFSIGGAQRNRRSTTRVFQSFVVVVVVVGCYLQSSPTIRVGLQRRQTKRTWVRALTYLSARDSPVDGREGRDERRGENGGSI